MKIFPDPGDEGIAWMDLAGAVFGLPVGALVRGILGWVLSAGFAGILVRGVLALAGVTVGALGGAFGGFVLGTLYAHFAVWYANKKYLKAVKRKRR